MCPTARLQNPASIIWPLKTNFHSIGQISEFSYVYLIILLYALHAHVIPFPEVQYYCEMHATVMTSLERD